MHIHRHTCTSAHEPATHKHAHDTCQREHVREHKHTHEHVHARTHSHTYTQTFSHSIAESDGEDTLHVYLPPLNPDVLSGDKSVDAEEVSLCPHAGI